MKLPNLTAAALTAAVTFLVLSTGAVAAGQWQRRYIHALAPRHFELKDQGSALQRAAFQQPDLLPIYGSSELDIGSPYHASELFKKYPTGFTVFPVGKAGTTDLIILQDLVAVGADLRGKKVAISLSAPWFFHSGQAADSYAGNFSRLHAAELAWSTVLSMDVKQQAARRMLQYPATLEKDPLLRNALENLAGTSLSNRVAYYGMLPLGKLQTLILRLQDDWETQKYIRSQKGLKPEVPRTGATLHWDALLDKATKEQKQHASNNPFGFDNDAWSRKFKDEAPKQPAKKPRDTQFVKDLRGSKEWTDLDLVLRALREMGAEPIVLSMPIQGTYYDYTGVTRAARQTYYDKLHEVVQPYDVPVLDFADHDEDKYFLIDPGAHLSRQGWVYYDKALDQFYHGTHR